MEINRFENVKGVVTADEVVEGRFGLLVANSVTNDFGSLADLPGFRVPATAEEAKRAKYVITFEVTSQKPPFYVPVPHYDWALRNGGFDQATNTPFSATVHTVYPGYKNSMTIPSGVPALAFGEGTYTIPSGQYIYDANLRNPGSPVIVANTAEDTTDAVKPKYQATMDERVIGTVRYFDTSTYDLTIDVF